MKPEILIVDDSLTVRMDLGETLEAAGISTALCATIQEARTLLLQRRFGLIILDVLLPDGDGIDFLCELKSHAATALVPVMLLSTEAEVRDRIRGLKTGADEYVGKPYDSVYIVGRARELLQKSLSVADGSARKIVVIDDSASFREQLKAVLQEASYHVETASSGEDGLRLVGACRPDAVIVDGVLPGIDGATVIRHIRMDGALRYTLCMLLTASEGSASEVQALDAGADAYARKEGDCGVVLAKLTAMLRYSAEESRKTAASLQSPKKILAVDDSDTYLHELTEQLTSQGYDVVKARNGEEALELLAVQSVDCILMDVLMPGMSGIETCRKIKGMPELRDVPLILLTAHGERQAMIAGIDAGADDYVPKASDFEVVRARLRAQLRRKQFQDENRHIRTELMRKEFEAAQARAAHELAETRALLLKDLAQKNEELEAFSYSVSHDLRAPLRAIDGFSQIIAQNHTGQLSADGQECFRRVRESAKRMGMLIDDLLMLSRVTSGELHKAPVNLSAISETVLLELRQREPLRRVDCRIAPNVLVQGDHRLLHILLENLLGNAWKYTGKRDAATIEFGTGQHNGGTSCFVRDNGAGFDMAYASRLFTPFQRLHTAGEFPGSGIGLAIVQRIVRRHVGSISIESKIDAGTVVFFTI